MSSTSLVSLQQVASEDCPRPSSDGVPALLTHPHLLPSLQVGGDLGGALVVVVQRTLSKHLIQDNPVLVDGQEGGRVLVHGHEGQEEPIHAAHWSCEDARLRIVAVANVGDDVVKLQGAVGG